MEDYKLIDGYENYSINCKGKIIRNSNGKEIKSFVLPNGYSRVNLYKDGKARQLSVHRLVALAFLGNPPTEKHVVNHKNAIRHDNDVNNLEWLTTSENVKYGYDYGKVDKEKVNKHLATVRKLANQARKKKIIVNSPEGISKTFNSVVEAECFYGLKTGLQGVARGQRKSHLGYTAKYI